MGKFLNVNGLQKVWTAVKNLVKAKVTDQLGEANGIATLGADSKLTASQLPAIKTINGDSLIGEGNITIDTAIAEVVTELPTENIKAGKMYLVPDTNDVEGNLYDEYLYVDGKWEKVGSYRASVELADYVKDSDVLTDDEIDAILSDTSDPS